MELNVSIYIDGLLKGSKKVTTPCLIGRSKDAGLTVAHPAMSRKHCELYEDGGKLFLKDNSSLNGTLYKGEYVETPVELPFNDEFTVGELTFQVTTASSAPSQERQEIADRPTAAIEIVDLNEDRDAQAGMATILHPPTPMDESKSGDSLTDGLSVDEKQSDQSSDKQGDQRVSEKNPEAGQPGKRAKKISPKDVRININ